MCITTFKHPLPPSIPSSLLTPSNSFTPSGIRYVLLEDSKYKLTRPQLTKDQLVSVLPALISHLQADNYVIYSYAAITIERILFIKHDQHALRVALCDS